MYDSGCPPAKSFEVNDIIARHKLKKITEKIANIKNGVST